MIRPNDNPFNPFSIDDNGQLFIQGTDVYRRLSSQAQETVRQIEDSNMWAPLNEAGLVKTDFADKAAGVVKHEFIPFVVYPQEFSPKMFQEAALCILNIAIILEPQGMHLHDAHPWNVSFLNGRAVFLDFTSIRPGRQLSNWWIAEFFVYVYLPLWALAHKWKRPISDLLTILRFGYDYLSTSRLRYLAFDFWRIYLRNRRTICQCPGPFLRELRSHIESLVIPRYSTEWENYDSPGGDYSDHSSFGAKAVAVERFISSLPPGRMVDMACNTGWFAGLATKFGFTVLGIDYDRNAVEDAQTYRTRQFRFNVAHMNLLHPTPPCGIALGLPSAIQRWQCDTALLSGLMHHLCLRQSLSFDGLLSLVSSYGARNVIIEFIPETDMHIQGWKINSNIKLPEWYSETVLISTFTRLFPIFEKLECAKADPGGPESSRRSVLLFKR